MAMPPQPPPQLPPRPSPQPHPGPAGKPRKAALAAWIGSALEYYDFFVYGTAAALIFNKIFFPSSNPTTGTLLSLATFGVAYVARPVGAFFLGHVGDKFGRKRVLVFTVLLMGLSTFLVGCLPTYHQAGILAPAGLVVLRLMQGLAAAGEQAGANSMTLEHSPEHRRGYFTSFTLGGTQAGQALGTAVFLPFAALPQEQLMSWGWRVPFLLSAIVVVAALIIRRSLEETPVFQREIRTEAVKLPVAILFRDHWPSVLRVIGGSLIASVSTMFTVFALSYAVNSAGLSKTPMLWLGVVANIVALGAIPAWALLSDRIGRKPVFIGGSLASAALLFAYLWSISTGHFGLIFGLGILTFGLAYSAPNGVWPAFYGEMFSTRVRLSGMAIGTQIGFAISGFAPTVATALAGSGKGSWLGVSAFTAVLCVISVIAASTARESHKIPTDLLGRSRADSSPERASAPV